jgi:hypothetical protein
MDSRSIASASAKPIEISLHDVVDDLIMATSPHAARYGNLISNDVSPGIKIIPNSEKIKRLIKRILDLIISVTRKDHINISAKTYTDLVLVHFKEINIQNLSPVYNELRQMVSDAEKLGGFLGITSYQNRSATIAFTFMNTKSFQDHYLNRLTKTISATTHGLAK